MVVILWYTVITNTETSAGWSREVYLVGQGEDCFFVEMKAIIIQWRFACGVWDANSWTKSICNNFPV